jgi:hypothetical protein
MRNSLKGSFFRFLRFNLEAFIWLTALILLAFMNPENTQQTLCLWHHTGFDSCPGCGLGHSISAAFHGKILESFNFHPFGLFAILILVLRIVRVFSQNFILISPKTNQYVKDL